MKNYSAKKFQKKGFSLIDFAIWITIFSVMVIGFLAVSSAQNKHKNFVADNLEKQKIRDKINSYVLKEISIQGDNINGILIHKSCNKDGNSSSNSCTEDNLKQITNSINNSIKSNLGFVPYQTLGLNQEDAVDSNNKFYLFLAHQPVSNKPYQYYVFSQPEDVLTSEYVNNIINNSETQNNSQNNIIPSSQLSNCHINPTISKNSDGITTQDTKFNFNILSGVTKEVNCSSYNEPDNKIYYKNNVNINPPSNDSITFQCFSGGNDYTPSQKCERVCKTFTTFDNATYDVEPSFFGSIVNINPTGADNSSSPKPYSAIYDALKISKSQGSILKLKCGANYIYEIEPITGNNCLSNYILSDDRKSCQYTCAINQNSIGAGSNTARYANGTTYQKIITDTTCVANTRAKDTTLATQVISCSEATPEITLTSGSDTYKICQCDASNYYVQNNQNQCVKGCKMSLDVVGPGNLFDNDKLYYQGQSVSQVLADTTCLPNASKNNAFFTTEQVVKHVSNQNYCILRRPVTQTLWAVENFKQKLCSCNSGYSMLAENSIANSSSEGGAFYNFPGSNATYKYSNRNFTAKYDCFLMCSATTNDLSKQNVANSDGNLTNLTIGYHQYGLTARQEAIINSLNSIINYKEYGTQPTIIPNLFYDGVNKKTLQPLNCSASSGSNVNYCLNTNLSGKRLFSTTCGASNDSLPFLQIKSGGSL